jgi:non-specific serine/threonine protein kinase
MSVDCARLQDCGSTNYADETFGTVLRNHRRAAGLTQEELAERASLSVRSVSGWERGEGASPRRDTLALLIRALGLSDPDRAAFEALVVRAPSHRSEPPISSAKPPISSASDLRREQHNVGRSIDTFVGRERDLEELGSLLLSAPLVTLVGAGGVGKTRLARELVRSRASQFVDGAWLVQLAELSDPSLLPDAIAASVGLHEVSARSTAALLAEYLQSKHVLLVLDNCEHLIAGCAELVARLLETCPRLHVMSTSREALSIDGEIVWPVQPLEVPDLNTRQTAAQLSRTAAVRLFVERATAVNPRFVVTDENAAVLANICVALDGLPLAVELAAPLTRILSLHEISERLGCDADILRSSSRFGSARHRTIRSTIDWSHALLDERERVLMRRLSVFAGGWNLQMAEEVCSGAGIERREILDVLAQLVDKSVVVADATESAARYRLLEPIRQYALERLEEAGEAAEFAARHSALMLAMPRVGENPGDFGPEEIASLQRYEVEHANLRAALRWALNHGESGAALRAAATLFRFWERRGHLQEGCAWLEEALAKGGDAPAAYRGAALNSLAFLYWRLGDVARALPVAEQALEVNRDGKKTLALAFALGNMGIIAYIRDEPEEGVRWLQESVAMSREIGYRPMLSVALTFLGRSLLRLHGPSDPRPIQVLQESLALAEKAHAHYAMGHALLALGDVSWRLGEVQRAITDWSRALEIQAQLADTRAMTASIERLAWGLVTIRDFESAARLFGVAHAQRRMLGITLRHELSVDHHELLTEALQQLGRDFYGAWLVGEGSSVEDAVAFALDLTRKNSL